MFLQGHPRSLILAPIQSSYGTVLVHNGNSSPILPRFTAFIRRKPLFSYLSPIRAEISGVSLGVDNVGVCGERTPQANREIILKNSNLCEHDTSTLRTDRWTDDLPWQYRALRSIARQKSTKNNYTKHASRDSNACMKAPSDEIYNKSTICCRITISCCWLTYNHGHITVVWAIISRIDRLQIANFVHYSDCRHLYIIIHRVPKKEVTKLLAITFSNLNRFSKFFHC